MNVAQIGTGPVVFVAEDRCGKGVDERKGKVRLRDRQVELAPSVRKLQGQQLRKETIR